MYHTTTCPPLPIDFQSSMTPSQLARLYSTNNSPKKDYVDAEATIEEENDFNLETVSSLRSDNIEVILIGTNHLSSRSAEEVTAIIQERKPEIVVVELCEYRAKQIMKKIPTRQEFLHKLSSKILRSYVPQLTMSSILGILTKVIEEILDHFYLMFRSMGLAPGQEFKNAIVEAKALEAQLILADRKAKETLKLLMATFNITNLFGSFGIKLPPIQKLGEDLSWDDLQELQNLAEKMKTRKTAREINRYLDEAFPKIATVLVHERDQIMFRHLTGAIEQWYQQNAQEQEENKENSSSHQNKEKPLHIVMVVGMAHMDGIELLWEDYKNNLSSNK